MWMYELITLAECAVLVLGHEATALLDRGSPNCADTLHKLMYHTALCLLLTV